MNIGPRELDLVIDIAEQGGRLVRRMQREGLTQIQGKSNDIDIVTEADLANERFIRQALAEHFPEVDFWGEESNQPPESELYWIVDPIDGTNNFAHRMLFFTVSIAVMHEGEPIVGVIFEPATDSMYTAVKGADAQLDGRRITASEEAIDKFASVGLESHFEGGAPGWACELMTRTRFRNLGTTALQLAYVAKGSMVATIANTPKLWDIAAGVVINEAAGSRITNWQGEKIFPVDLDGYDGHKYQVVVANTKVHPEVITLLNR